MPGLRCLDVRRNLAIALHVSTDALMFKAEERGPDDQAMVRQRSEAVLPKHQAKRWAS